jgi:hypothetical protein
VNFDSFSPLAGIPPIPFRAQFNSFWTLVGASAPVIALANVVGLRTSMTLLDSIFFRTRLPPRPLRGDWIVFRGGILVSLLISFGNLIVQSIILLGALTNLLLGVNASSFSFAVQGEFLGLLAVAVVVIMSAGIKIWASRYERQGLGKILGDNFGGNDAFAGPPSWVEQRKRGKRRESHKTVLLTGPPIYQEPVKPSPKGSDEDKEGED